MSEQPTPTEPAAPVAPEQPTAQPETQAQPAAQPVVENKSYDINDLMKEVDDQKQKEKQELIKSLDEMISSRLEQKASVEKEKIEKLQAQIKDIESKAQQQKEELIKSHKEELKQQANRFEKIDEFLSTRQSVVPNQNNPFREQPQSDKPTGLLDRQDLSERQRYEMFIRSLR